MMSTDLLIDNIEEDVDGGTASSLDSVVWVIHQAWYNSDEFPHDTLKDYQVPQGMEDLSEEQQEAINAVVFECPICNWLLPIEDQDEDAIDDGEKPCRGCSA